MSYNAASWYWIVASSATQVYSSAAAAYVPVSDVGYVAWLVAGNRPSRIASEAELVDVLVGAGLAVTGLGTPAQQARALLSAGIAISSTSTPAVNGTYPFVTGQTDAHIYAELFSISLTGAFADGSSTVLWLDVAGTPHTFPSIAVFQAFATAMCRFAAGCIKAIEGTATTLPSATATIP